MDVSTTESLTAKRMEQLNKAKEDHGFTNVWTTDGRILFKRPIENKNGTTLCYLCKNLFFILGVLCVVFLYQKNFLTGIAPLINKLVFKKLIIQFFNHCFIISFIKFVAMILILLKILKSIKKFLVSIIILLCVKKSSNV